MGKYVLHFLLWIGLVLFIEGIKDVYAQEQDIYLTATVDKKILALNEHLQLTLTIHGSQDPPPPSFPEINGFKLLFGPKISAQTRIINGEVSVSKGFTYVLQPTTTGKFTIGKSTLNYEGRIYSSQPISVEVVDVKQRDAGLQHQDIEKLMFVELEADKVEPYIYEQVVLSFRFYFQKGLSISDIEYTAPATKNFMKEKLGDQRQYEVIRDGIIYNVLELRTALFPMASGKLVISPARLNLNLTVREQRGQDFPGDGFFDDTFFNDFFGRARKKYPVEKITEPIILKVKPLPEEGKPEYFKGAVGTYQMNVSTKAQKVKIGDPVTLTISVFGEGNIQAINEPSLILTNKDDFKLYPAESITQITNREETVRGRKVFTKVIEPQKADIKGTPDVVFSFFDPRTEQYSTIIEKSIPVVVEAAREEIPIQLTISGENDLPHKEQTRLLTQDVFPIMTRVSFLQNQARPLYSRPLVIICLSFPTAVVIASFLLTKYRQKLTTDIGYTRKKRAYSRAKKGLAEIRSTLSQDNTSGFYSSLSRILAAYLADKCNIPPASACSEDIIETLLKQHRVKGDTIKETLQCLTDFDYRRFSRDEGTLEEMNRSLNIADQLILKLENEIT